MYLFCPYLYLLHFSYLFSVQINVVIKFSMFLNLLINNVDKIQT